MHRLMKIFYLVLSISITLGFCGCDKPKTIILFNKNPITKENILNNSSAFTPGRRIYYIFITERPLDTEFIRVRVLKQNKKANFIPTKIAYSNDFKLHKNQIYYYNDYIVINSAGYYCMVIYAKNDMRRPLAIADFKVGD